MPPIARSRPYPPGEHGRDRMRQGSEYLAQLREKQKARRIYGVLGEAVPQPLRGGEPPARASPARTCCGSSSCASTTSAFRAGWGASRAQARQLVRHGHVQVNGKRVDDPQLPRAQGRRRRASSPRPARLIVVRRNLDTLDRTLPGVARGRRGRLRRSRVRDAAPARADRRAGPRAAHRRALLEVIRPPEPTDHEESIDAHHPATHRRGPRRGGRQPPAVRHRAARARLRPHARQLAAPHAAVVDPRRGGHPGPVRRRPARVRPSSRA